jgi:hypothetical protein
MTAIRNIHGSLLAGVEALVARVEALVARVGPKLADPRLFEAFRPFKLFGLWALGGFAFPSVQQTALNWRSHVVPS